MPPSQMNYQAAKIRTWLVIKWSGLKGALSFMDISTWNSKLQTFFNETQQEGVGIELVGATADYGLNEIPTATATVAVGRQILRDPNSSMLNTLSIIHYLTRNLKMFIPASIFVEGTSTDYIGPLPGMNPTTGTNWPADLVGGGIDPRPFRIFDGYIIGSGFRKSFKGVEFNLSLIHWLSDLNFSSTLSRSSSPTNPGQVSFNPALPIATSAGAIAPTLTGHGAPFTQPMTLITPSVLLADMWGALTGAAATPDVHNGVPTPKDAKGILLNDGTNQHGGLKYWLTNLCLNDRMNWQQIQLGACNSTPNAVGQKNTEALAALMKIEPLARASDGANCYIDGVPMAMNNLVGIQNIASQMASDIGYETPDVLAGTTIWDKLIAQYGSNYLFSVVPQVDKALIVPFNPGLRSYWTTINASEYDFLEVNQHIPRPLRGVGLMIGREFNGGSGISLTSSPVFNVPGAYYENPNRRNGMVIFKKAPRWISTVILPHLFTAAGQKWIINSTFDTKATTGQPTRLAPANLINQVQSLWCGYAQSLYIQEILRGRTGRLSGRLRFDICPGSVLQIEEPEEKFVQAQMIADAAAGSNPAPVGYMYAMCIRVSIVLNAENQQAGTAFELAFCRNSAENTDNSYSTDTHPIWANNWTGAPLVQDPDCYPAGKGPNAS